MASRQRKDQYAHGRAVHATCLGEDWSTGTTCPSSPSPSQATSAVAADGRGDVSPPPPTYVPYKEPVPAASGARATNESSSAALLLPPSPWPRSPAWSHSADAAACEARGSSSACIKKVSAAPPSAANSCGLPRFSLAEGAGVQKGGRWNSAATSAHTKAFAGAALIPAPDAVASRPGTSGSTSHSGGVLSSPAKGGAHLSSRPPAQASFRRGIGKSQGSSSTGRSLLPAHVHQPCPQEIRASPSLQISDHTESSYTEAAADRKGKSVTATLSTGSCSDEQIIDHAESSYTEAAADQKGKSVTATLSMGSCSYDQGDSVQQVKKIPQGSRYWEVHECPADVEGINPPGFYSPHPVWEGFAIPVQEKGRKESFYCVACKKVLSGDAARVRRHVLVSKGCATSEERKMDLKARIKEFEDRRNDSKRKHKNSNVGVTQELDQLSDTTECASSHVPYPPGGPEGADVRTPSSSGLESERDKEVLLQGANALQTTALASHAAYSTAVVTRRIRDVADETAGEDE